MKTDEQFHRAKSIFLRACDLETSARAEVIDAACGDDEELKREVESLLRHYPMPEMPTNGPVDSDATVRDDGGRRHGALEHVGPYRIIGEIQRGGMGVVYLATREDGRFKRRAAVKVIKRGMDTEEVLRRFELERQVLAALNHPNIARLFDGGETDDGRPYFAMEYVDGLPLDQYCDKHRLRIGERLRLFEQVCRAVHYAHQNLVVHRDLKPGNIMVTESGSPKLLDFGIAKIINPEMPLVMSDPTAPQLRVMTPEYASPEQVRGDPIGTASDVYSLGVLLYELVTGHRPYHIRTRMQDEIVRIVCEEDPDRPSTKITESEEPQEPSEPGTASTKTITPDTVSKLRETRPARLRKSLAGDVDNIVMKALRKETQRRYTSAEQFAEDIRNHLCGLPVIARKDSWSYRTTKFVHRHRIGVAMAAVVALAVVAGLGGTTLGMTQAQARLETMREVANLLLFDVFDEVRRVDMSLPAQKLVAETGLAYLEEARLAAGDSPELTAELAAGYDRLGELYGGRRGFTLGDFEQAAACYMTARELRSTVVGTSFDDGVRLQSDMAANQIHYGDLLRRKDDVESALAEYRAALAQYQTVFRQHPTEETERLVSVGYLQVGKGLVDRGKDAEALRHYESALEIRERLANSSLTFKSKRDLSTAHIRVAARKAKLGDPEGARDHFRRAKDIREGLFRVDPTDTTNRRDLRWANHFLIDHQLEHGEAEGAVAAARQNVAVLGHAVEMNPRDTRLAGDLPLAYALLGKALIKAGEADEAMLMFEEAQRQADRAIVLFPSNLDYQMHRVETLLEFARGLQAEGRNADMLAKLDQAEDGCRTILSVDPGRKTAQARLKAARSLRQAVGPADG